MVVNVRAINGLDIETIAKEISEASIMATAVGVNVLPKIIYPIAEGIKKRLHIRNYEPLNIIICENLLHADHYLKGLILQELNPEETDYFNKYIGLVEASIGRMVPITTKEMQKGNILRVSVEEYGELPVDKDAFKGEIPNITNLHPFSPFIYYIRRKLFIHNMGHAITAYLGRLKNYTYIWEAINDKEIKNIVFGAMCDSGKALSKEHGINFEEILNHVNDLINRFGNKLLGDTVKRVGNDTKRKLSPNDRLIGAAELCLSNGIAPKSLYIGIAAAMHFDLLDSDSISEVKDLLISKGPTAVLKEICNLSHESAIYENVLSYYDKIKKNKFSFSDIS